MKLTPLHERLLADILDLGSPYPLVLTGGYAVQAHGLVERFDRDLDVATENPAPMQEIVASLTAGLCARGWRTTHVQTDTLSDRFLVTDPATGEECEVDVLKEAFWAPPAQTPYGPVLSLDDVIDQPVPEVFEAELVVGATAAQGFEVGGGAVAGGSLDVDEVADGAAVGEGTDLGGPGAVSSPGGAVQVLALLPQATRHQAPEPPVRTPGRLQVEDGAVLNEVLTWRIVR
ncbi:hypothetical protein [Streptomyces tendae]|uniref:hypothetical protein n=1 Tax=Streptomyces tendae TaxID=1932 RepID=UPI003662B968